MKCPHCNKVLSMAERKGIEIDYCPSCRGGWLDRGELDKIIALSIDERMGSSRSSKSNAYYQASSDKSFLSEKPSLSQSVSGYVDKFEKNSGQ